MKLKFRLFHFPVYIFVFIGLLLTFYLYFTQPRDSLYDYALTLEDGQFVSETSGLWETSVVFPRSCRIFVEHAGDVEDRNLRTDFYGMSADKLLPHEFAMAINHYERVFLGSDGSVWYNVQDPVRPTTALLEQDSALSAPVTPSDIPEIGNVTLKEYGSSVTSIQVREHATLIKFFFTSDKAELTDPACYLYVRLKDGWYRYSSRDLPRRYYGHPDKFTKKMYIGWVSFPNCVIDTKLTAQCRIEVYDGSELIAAKEFEVLAH